MGACRYNGVRLPELPQWDTAAYPYACIQYIPYRNGGFIAHLRCSDRPFMANGGVITNPAGAVILIHTFMGSADTVWGPAYSAGNLALALDPGTVVWTNTDLTGEDGSLVLAASEPVPVQPVPIPDFCLNSWLTGFITGLAGTAGTPGADAFQLQGWIMGRKTARSRQPG